MISVIKNKRVKKFLILSFLGLILINFTFASALSIFTNYGSLTLNPGEKYIVNIPFIGPSRSPIICGIAQQTDGITPLKNILVIVKYSKNDTLLAKNITGSDGKYCITLPEITSNKKFDIYLEYDNITSSGDSITLASNDYDLNFDNDKIYNKSSDEYVFLTGNITNEDAGIENGRIEIKLGSCKTTCQGTRGTYDYTKFGGNKKYFVNIAPNEIYQVPNDELNVSWDISDLEPNRYKIIIKTSFNGKEKSRNIFFNITG